jgi:hypothetical protein
MAKEREVVIKGDLVTTWNTLNNILSYNGYIIKYMAPYTRIRAERGSKFVSGLVGGTKDGHRTIDITVQPSDQNILIKFIISFSAWGAGISYKSSVDEIDEMIRSFQNQCAYIQKSYSCKTCGQPLRFINEYQRWYCHNCRKYI